jgi:DNA invertase Pin-like site-specific DNA recombinase
MTKAALKVRLRRAIKASGHTITWVAEYIGCSRVTVYNWLSGDVAVSPAYQAKVERFIAKHAGQ